MAWPWLLGAAGLCAVYWPTLASGFSRVQVDSGDSRFNNYFLENGWAWLRGVPGHERFWDAPIFHPQANATAFSDHMLGAAPLYWLLRLGGFAPDTSYQLWLILVLGLDFAASYAWLRRGLLLHEDAAAFGAALFCFGAPLSAQLIHNQLYPMYGLLLSLHALTVLLRGEPLPEAQERRWAAAVPLGLAVQSYASFYSAWLWCLGLSVAGAWALAFPVSRRALAGLARRRWGSFLAGAAASAALVAPAAWHYWLVAREFGWRDWIQVSPMVPRPRSWVNMGASSWWYGRLFDRPAFTGLPMPHEHALGLGFLTASAAAAGLWGRRERPWVRAMALAGATLVVVTTLWAGDFTLWRWVMPWLPGARGIRALSRVGLLLLLPAALGLAWLVQDSRRRALALAVAAACLLEQGRTSGSFDKSAARRRVEEVAALVDPARCGAFFYSPEIPRGARYPQWLGQVDAMWSEYLHHVPTVNGYSANWPKDWNGLEIHQLSNAYDEKRVAAGLETWVRARGLDRSRLCWVRRKVPAFEGE